LTAKTEPTKLSLAQKQPPGDSWPRSWQPCRYRIGPPSWRTYPKRPSANIWTSRGCGTSTRHAEGPTDGNGHEMTAKPKAGSWWDRHQALHPQIALRKSGILNIAPRLLVGIVNIASLCAAVTGRWPDQPHAKSLSGSDSNEDDQDESATKSLSGSGFGLPDAPRLTNAGASG